MTTNYDKYLNQLSTLVEEVEHEKEDELFLVKWLKIYRICLDGLQISTLTSDERLRLLRIQQHFTQKVIPVITHFKKQTQLLPMKEYLDQYTQKAFMMLEDAEDNLKLLPMKALETLENLLFFINLYAYRLHPTIPRLLKDRVKEKIRILIKGFEIEGGTKDLVQQEAQLTQGLKQNLQGLAGKPGVGNSFVEPTFSSNQSSNNEISNDSISIDSDTVIGQLAFPEEPKPDEIRVAKHIEIAVPKPLQPISPAISSQQGPTQVYPYSVWIPMSQWESFVQYRYCQNCGSIINPTNRQCIGCQKVY
jgi:hypothetical protein